MLDMVFELRQEIIQLLNSRNCDLVKDFQSKDAVLRLAYLEYIFSQLNESNTSIQGFRNYANFHLIQFLWKTIERIVQLIFFY